MMRVSLTELNQMNSKPFVATLADIFEHSPWVAACSFSSRPFNTVNDLHSAMVSCVAQAELDKQLALIRAHPDLAGKTALAGDLTEASTKEQAGAGLNSLSEIEYKAFHDLNNRYKQKFNFPFILAVKGHTKHSILDAFRSRLENNLEEEHQTALAQIALIGKFRLEDLVRES